MFGLDRQRRTTGVDKLNWQDFWAAKYADGKIWQHWSFRMKTTKKAQHQQHQQQRKKKHAASATEHKKREHIPIENYTNNLWNETVIREWKCGLNDMRHVLLICCRERVSVRTPIRNGKKIYIPWHIRFASVCRTRVRSIGCAQISKSLRLDTTLSVIVIIHQTHSDFPLRLMRDQLNKNIIAWALKEMAAPLLYFNKQQASFMHDVSAEASIL